MSDKILKFHFITKAFISCFKNINFKNFYPVLITLKIKMYRQLKQMDMAPLMNNFRPLQPVNNRKVSSEAIVLVLAES